MKIGPFSLLIDGSNDTNLDKLNPLTVRIYDHSRRQVTMQLLDMCTTSGRDCGTASAIFTKVDSVLSTLNIPWQHCVRFVVDNTSVNIGRHHSIKTEVQARNPACYFMGCPCHLLHNIASHASEALHRVSKFDVEDMCIDIFYWFYKSTKRKGILNEFCEFCDNNYREIVRYVSVRWLSLEQAVHRILQLYQSLKSYFLSENEPQLRFSRLRVVFENPISEVYLLFYQAVLPVFSKLNLLLQREYPTIYLISDEIRSFLKKLLGKFMKIEAIRAKDDVTNVDYLCEDNQLSNCELTIGVMTKQLIRRLFENGDIDENAVKTFYKSVRAFYVDATTQALQKLPFADDLLNHSKFLNFPQRANCSFSSVDYFCFTYSNLLQFAPTELDRVQEEFIDYQLLENSHIPQPIWKEATVTENDIGTEHHRMDLIWGHIAKICNVDGSKRFSNLFKVAKLILCIPHSNAGEKESSI